MNWIELLGLAIALTMDAFAVALAVGMSLDSATPRHSFRLAFHFGLFEFMMPVIGWLAGTRMAVFLAGYDQLLAFGLLTFVGGKMLWDAHYPERRKNRGDPTKGLLLVALSITISLDGLALGMSMALLKNPILLPAAAIGLMSAMLTMIGIRFGQRIGPRWGHWAERAGGCVLLLIALQPLYSFLTAHPSVPR